MSKIRMFLRRYSLVTLMPGSVAAFIYYDYSLREFKTTTEIEPVLAKMSYVRLLTVNMFPIVIPLTGYLIGHQMDKYYDEQMSLFRDKSALYGKVKAEGEPPSWH